MGNYLSNLLSVIGFYLLIPNGIVLQTSSAFIFSLLVCANTYMRASALSPLDWYAVGVCFVLANLVGIVGSARLNGFRRNEFLAQEALNDLVVQRERLIHETNHRVKNNLVAVDSLLSLQAADSESETAQRELEETRERIQSIRLIHDALSNAQTRTDISMSAFLRSLTLSLQHIYRSDASGIAMLHELVDFPSEPGLASSCGMMVTELVVNALKYAFPNGKTGSILLRTEYEDGRCRITVADDGIGLPVGFDLEKCPSLGLKIVSGYASQLHGALTVDSRPGSGARFRIEFPLKTQPPISGIREMH